MRSALSSESSAINFIEYQERQIRVRQEQLINPPTPIQEPSISLGAILTKDIRFPIVVLILLFIASGLIQLIERNISFTIELMIYSTLTITVIRLVQPILPFLILYIGAMYAFVIIAMYTNSILLCVIGTYIFYKIGEFIFIRIIFPPIRKFSLLRWRFLKFIREKIDGQQ